jgi:RNA polymerase sigma-70 factor (ECF subfamily)
MRKRRGRKETCATTSNPDTGKVELYEQVDRSPGPEAIYLKQQSILLLRREVEKLHPSLRSVVSHYYGAECSLEEAANAQEITVAAAKSRILRGRVRLRSSLARYGISKSTH